MLSFQTILPRNEERENYLGNKTLRLTRRQVEKHHARGKQ